MLSRLAVFLSAVLLLAACAQEEPPPPPKAKEGRAETRSIRNLDAVGYSGSAIANKIDASLNAQEQQERELKRRVEQQSSGQPAPAAGTEPPPPE